MTVFIGDKVEYHGAIEKAHGSYEVIGMDRLPGTGHALYTLVSTEPRGPAIYGVHSESFSVTQPAFTRPERIRS